MAFLFALPAVLLSVLAVPLTSRAAKGRLRRNQWVGIRTPSTMRSDQAWIAGHAAAQRLAPLYVIPTLVTCVALFAIALSASMNALLIVGFASWAVVFALAVWSAIIASRAAKNRQ